jgi:hypothetical protein
MVVKPQWDKKRLLAAYRDERGPSPVDEERLWIRVRANLDHAQRGVRGGSRPSRGSLWLVAALVSAAAAAILIAWPGRRVVDTHRPESDPALLQHDRGEGALRETTERPIPRPIAVPEASSSEPTEPPPTAAPQEDPATRDARGPISEVRRSRAPRNGPRTLDPAGKADPAPSVDQDSLAAETQLLRKAREALTRGEPDRALTVLAEYERTHPRGLLAEEADAVRTIAKCRLHRSAGPELARSFSARHRTSLFLAKVQAACTLEGGGP